MKETAYLLQSALVAAWWLGLIASRTFFRAFQFDGISETAFWAFFLPDAFGIAGLSLVRAYRRSAAVEYIILGAFTYASLYCCNATLLTRSGYLPTGLMVLGLIYNLFLCFERSVFRPSASHVTSINGIKTCIQIFCIWVLALAVVPYIILDAFDALHFPAASVSTWGGATLFVACSILGGISSIVMVRDGRGTPLPLDQTNNLVISGPYRFVRNPMAMAGIGQGVALAVVFLSIPLLVYSLLGALFWQFVVRPIEERDLEDRFGEPYREYRRKVGCWIPRFGRS